MSIAIGVPFPAGSAGRTTAHAGASPGHLAVDETGTRLGDERYCCYAAAGSGPARCAPFVATGREPEFRRCLSRPSTNVVKNSPSTTDQRRAPRRRSAVLQAADHRHTSLRFHPTHARTEPLANISVTSQNDEIHGFHTFLTALARTRETKFGGCVADRRVRDCCGRRLEPPVDDPRRQERRLEYSPGENSARTESFIN